MGDTVRNLLHRHLHQLQRLSPAASRRRGRAPHARLARKVKRRVILIRCLEMISSLAEELPFSALPIILSLRV